MTYRKLHLEILRLLVLSLVLLAILAVYSFHLPEKNTISSDLENIAAKAPTELAGWPIFSETALVGKSIFKANCGSCHHKNMVDKLTGPALAHSKENWADYPREDLYRWISNPAKLAADGHPRAKQLMKEWSPIEMTAFPNLSITEIDAIFTYIDEVVYDKNS